MATMQKSVGRIFILLFSLVFILPANAAPREKLHIVYVTNRDRAPLPGYEERLNHIMVDVQDFFRTEMKRNGYGPKTYMLDLDKSGKARVHLIKLDWDFDKDRKFTPKELRPVIAKELKKKGIDIDQEYIITFENAYWKDGDTWKYDVVYTGSGNPVKGATWVVDHERLDAKNFDPDLKDSINDRGQKLTTGRFNVKMIGGVAHEFGHALGLPHNKETKEEFKQHGKALMGAGNYTYRQERLGKRPNGSFLTPAHAFILSLHPLFNGRIPDSFELPDVFLDGLTFEIKSGKLVIAGKPVPADEVAGIVLYHDPLPTGVNKDYDAYSYLAKMHRDGTFSASMPALDDEECALHIKVYFKNGMHTKFSFTQEKGKNNGLESLRNGYLKEQVKHAFKQRDAAKLRSLMEPLKKIDAEAAKRAQLFMKSAEQWEQFTTPANVPSNEKKVSLSAARWDAASVGWYVPSFDGIMEPDGKWFRPLQSAKGNSPHGLFAHAPANYSYTLGGKWKKFRTRIGIQRGRRKGSVVFVVNGDGKELYRSSLIRLTDGEMPAEVNVAGVKKLELITESGPDGNEQDWGIWIAPTLHR